MQTYSMWCLQQEEDWKQKKISEKRGMAHTYVIRFQSGSNQQQTETWVLYGKLYAKITTI